MATKKCSECRYRGRIHGYFVCDYLKKTGMKRPCKSGEDCSVFEQLTQDNQIVFKIQLKLLSDENQAIHYYSNNPHSSGYKSFQKKFLET